jgi:hypothetical protein
MKKNLILSAAFAIGAFGASTAFAFSVPNLTCRVSEPCAHASSTALGYCVSGAFDIRTEGGQANALVVRQNEEIGQEVLRYAAVIPVRIEIAEGYRKIVGMTDEGDTWIDLHQEKLSRTSKTYVGQMALEEDFGFTLECEPTLQ